MSSSRLKNIGRADNYFGPRRDVTPKSGQESRVSRIYSNSKLAIKDNSKLSQSFASKNGRLKEQRPLSTKNVQSVRKYFSSKENEDADHKRHSHLNAYKLGQSYDRVLANPTQAVRWKSKSPKRIDDNTVKEEVFVVPRKYNIGSRQIRHSINSHPRIPKFVQNLPNHEPAKRSAKANGIIRCYAACTNQGPCRTYNEDRVAIILNTSKPGHCTTQWKKAAFFGVYDGHGGVSCADYLRDNLHSFLFKQKCFPNNIPEAMSLGFQKCETSFLQKSRSLPMIDKSGSCAVVAFVYGDTCYVGNVGDSRAIMSSGGGNRVSELSIDHKPSDDYQQKRIIEYGGKIYQVKIKNANPSLPIVYEGEELPYLMGPHRVLPGRLAVTRSVGDIESKLPELGGNPKVVIATPEIRSFKITPQNDFVLLASDGIFDKLTNDEIVQVIWQTAKEKEKFKSVHQFCGLAIQKVMKYSLYRRTQDNITVVILGFDNLQKIVMGTSSQAGSVRHLADTSQQKPRLQQSRKLSKTPPHNFDKKNPSITNSLSFLQKNKADLASKRDQYLSRYSPSNSEYRSTSFKRNN